MKWLVAVQRFLLPSAALVGVITGFLVPGPAYAIWQDFHLELWPGGGSSLTCGWHSGGCYDDDRSVVSGTALDWAPDGSVTFWVKSSTSSNLFAVAGSGWVSKDTQSGCTHQAHVSVYDNGSTWRATATYLHTASTFTIHSINIATSYPGLSSTTEYLGQTAYESGCPAWTNYHVHQIADGLTLRS